VKKLMKALIILSSFSILTRALGFLFRVCFVATYRRGRLGVIRAVSPYLWYSRHLFRAELPLVVSKKTSENVLKRTKMASWERVECSINWRITFPSYLRGSGYI
jgi:hypothetical protein